jgi:hypothetical protein
VPTGLRAYPSSGPPPAGAHRALLLSNACSLRLIHKYIRSPHTMPIPSLTASLSSGKLGREAPPVHFPSMSQIKKRAKYHNHPATPTSFPFLYLLTTHTSPRPPPNRSRGRIHTKAVPYLQKTTTLRGLCKLSPYLSPLLTSLSIHLPPSFSARPLSSNLPIPSHNIMSPGANSKAGPNELRVSTTHAVASRNPAEMGAATSSDGVIVGQHAAG